METRIEALSNVEEYVFKSYYVVWKHMFKVYEHLNAYSLNRTMQYGNFYRDK